MRTVLTPFKTSDRRPPWPSWPSVGILVVALAANPISVAYAQSPPKDADVRIAANPLLITTQREIPDLLSAVVARLSTLKSVSPSSGSRAGERPTAAEVAQISQNPDFAEAFNHDPADTVALLRWINQRLR